MASFWSLPTFGTGYARNPGESEYPELWHQLRGSWHPEFGHQGIASLFDFSGWSNGGTLNGTMTDADWVVGPQGYGLEFDGSDDYVSVANEPVFDFERTDGFSFSFWVKFASTNSSMGLLSKALNGSPPTGFTIFQRAGTTNQTVAFEITGSNNTRSSVRTNNEWSPNVWRHVVCTYSGNSLNSGQRIYVNGADQALTSIFNTLSASILNDQAFQISGRQGANFLTTATINNVLVWRRELMPGEARLLFSGASPHTLRKRRVYAQQQPSLIWNPAAAFAPLLVR